MQRYMSAIETTGPVRYRKQILRAMAESPNDFVTMDELVGRIAGYIGVVPPSSTTLSGPLQQLKQARFGEILRDVDRPAEEAGRVYNLTAFKDPRMKAFIRAINAVDEQGWLPTATEVAVLPPSRGIPESTKRGEQTLFALEREQEQIDHPERVILTQ